MAGLSRDAELSIAAMRKRWQEKLPRAIAEDLKRDVVAIAGRTVDAMQAAAPVDTGALRDSIVVTGPGQSTPAYSQGAPSRTAGPFEALITAGNTRVRYAHILEFGTRKHAAQPFFWPLWRLRKRTMKNEMAKAWRAAFKRFAKDNG